MKPINILLIEDNEGDILLTTDAFKEFTIPNTVSVLRDGWEGVQYVENVGKYYDRPEPDLILLDINLPKINGHEFLYRLKNNNSKKHIPVVVLSTSSTPADILSSYRNYANCYITKPVDVEEFNKVLLSIENFWLSIAKLPKDA